MTSLKINYKSENDVDIIVNDISIADIITDISIHISSNNQPKLIVQFLPVEDMNLSIENIQLYNLVKEQYEAITS